MKKTKKILLISSVFLVALLILAFTPSKKEIHQNEKVIEAPKDIVWEVISDVGNYNKYATSLTEVKIVSGKGKGMVRSCAHGDDKWTEICSNWDEGKSYSFNVNTGEGFPYPFKIFNGTWSIEEKTKNKTKLIVRFEYQFPQRWMQWFFSRDTHIALDEGNTVLIDNWEKKILENYKFLSHKSK
ncbi:MAG: SRPBCC family protein [Bacteroidota bacterium]